MDLISSHRDTGHALAVIEPRKLEGCEFYSTRQDKCAEGAIFTPVEAM
jgi:hypothetical protein